MESTTTTFMSMVITWYLRFGSMKFADTRLKRFLILCCIPFLLYGLHLFAKTDTASIIITGFGYVPVTTEVLLLVTAAAALMATSLAVMGIVCLLKALYEWMMAPGLKKKRDEGFEQFRREIVRR